MDRKRSLLYRLDSIYTAVFHFHDLIDTRENRRRLSMQTEIVVRQLMNILARFVLCKEYFVQRTQTACTVIHSYKCCKQKIAIDRHEQRAVLLFHRTAAI